MKHGYKSLFAFVALFNFAQTTLAMGARVPAKKAGIKSYTSTSLSCSHKEASDGFNRLNLQNLPSPQLKSLGDGYGSWPLMVGVWVARKQDIYLAIHAKPILSGRDDYHLRVNMYSLCTGELLARGETPYVLRTDQKVKSVPIQLLSKSNELLLKSLVISLDVPKKDEEMNVSIQSKDSDDHVTVESFLMVRPLESEPWLKSRL